MSGAQHAATARVLPSADTVELNRALAYIRRCLQRMDGADLVKAGELVDDLSDVVPGRALGEFAESELRDFVSGGVESLYINQPEMLAVVHNFLDALARARAKRHHRQQTEGNPASLPAS